MSRGQYFDWDESEANLRASQNANLNIFGNFCAKVVQIHVESNL